MLSITIIVLGKLKESYWREAEKEYLKRLSGFANVTIRELKEMPFDEKANPETIKKKETEKIMAELEKLPDAIVFALDEHGKPMSSLALAENIAKWQRESSRFVFVLGGPLGLHPDVLAKATQTLSLSNLTFTHQMARVILLEQLYRAAMISSGRRYHY